MAAEAAACEGAAGALAEGIASLEAPLPPLPQEPAPSADVSADTEGAQQVRLPSAFSCEIALCCRRG